MKRLLLALVIVLAGWQKDGVAQRPPTTYTQYGNFGVSCGTFKSSTGLPRQGYEAWLLGFATGAGYVGLGAGTTLAVTDAGGAIAWVDKYCTDHPLELFARGAEALVIELSTRR